MTSLEQQRIDVLYEILERLENEREQDEDAVSALRWAIFELEQMYAD